MTGFEDAFVKYMVQNGPWAVICGLLIWLWIKERTAAAKKEADLATAIREKEQRFEEASEKYRAEALALQASAFGTVQSIQGTVGDLKVITSGLERIVAICTKGVGR